MMIHFLDTDPTDIAVTCSRRPIDVASETKFNPADFESLGDDIADLDMTFYMLIFGNT